MSAFSRGLQFGLMQGMLSNMFCFGGFERFGMFGGFFGNPFYGFSSSLFMMPVYSYGNFFQYNNPSTIWGMNYFEQSIPAIGLYNDTIIPPVYSETSTSSITAVTGQSDILKPEKVQTQKQERARKNSQRPKNITKKWYEMTDSELREIYGNYDRDITKPYLGTAEDLNKYLKGKGVLEGKGQAFIDAQNKYGISASVLAGICMFESGGTSQLARKNNNVGGVRRSGSYEFKKYDRVEDCIDDMAKFLKSGYVENNTRPLTKLYEINARYCPASDPSDKTGGNANWARMIEGKVSDIEKIRA